MGDALQAPPLNAALQDAGRAPGTDAAGLRRLAERKVDRIVANPPWVKLSDIQDKDRKRAMERLGQRLGLQAGGKQAPHLDVASCFVLRTRNLYAAAPEQDPAAWLVKKSALQSGHWASFRRRHAATLAQSVDLEALQPFGGGDATRCCLLLEHRPMRRAPKHARLLARRVGRLPKAQDALAVAQSCFELAKAPDPLPQAPSPYRAANIRQGATITPRCWWSFPQGHREPRGGRLWRPSHPCTSPGRA